MRYAVVLLLALLLASCSTPAQEETGSEHHQAHQIQGVIPNWSGTGMFVAANNGSTTYDFDDEGMLAPDVEDTVVSAAISADGSFTIDLPEPPTFVAEHQLCSGAPIGRGYIAGFVVSTVQVPDVEEDIVQRFHRSAGEDRWIAWVYSDEELDFRGDCHGRLVDVSFVRGWNVVTMVPGGAAVSGEAAGAEWVSGSIYN